MRSKSEKTKELLKMGTGDGANYKPYIQVGEFGSLGTSACVIDYKTGRVVHLLSQAEVMAWYQLRWDDNNLDIKEQYPLPLKETLEIAEKYGLRHPQKNSEYKRITTDLLIHRKDGDVALSIKANISKMNVNNLYIEMKYWESKGVIWKIIQKKDLSPVRYRNIRDVVHFYNVNEFPDLITFVKYLIAHKYIKVDMDAQLDYQQIIKEHEMEIEKWKNSALISGTSSDAMKKNTR